MRTRILRVASVAALAAVTALAGAASVQAARGLTVKGSDTMVILGQRWAETYMNTHPGAVVQVTGGGSGTGIAALINGTTDIYTGAVTNWKQVGGNDARITLYGRENSSGTYVYFKDNVLGGRDYAASVQTLPGTAAVVNAVAKDPNGIGYGGAAYAKGVKDCGVQKDAKSPALLPSAQTVQDGSYPITRYLYFYTRLRPAGDMKQFVDWVLSSEGQAVVTKVGYFPVK